MSLNRINFWIEGDISTTRIISRLLNDVVGEGNCHTELLTNIDWASLSSGSNIFCRVSDPRFRWLPAYLRKNGITYAYYLDDNFWKITGTSELARYYQSERVVSALDEFVRGAAFVITHNKMLADFIAQRFPGVKCDLLPVPFDMSLIREIESSTESRSDSSPVVGYAGGFKEEEFKFLEPVVKQLGKERPDIRFEFIGGISDSLRALNNVQWFPGSSDYAAFLSFKISRKWTVGLAPLMESEFNASKTNNKFREYGGCHIPGVYSNTSPYIESIRSGESGILVKNTTEAWIDAIKRLIDDKGLNEKVTQGAYDFVDENYSHESIAPIWKVALSKIPESPPSTALSRFRFSYVKRYHSHNLPLIAIALANSDHPVTLIKILLKRKITAFLSRLTIKHIVLLIALFSLIVANFYFIKAGAA
ncbi:glycosyltransferase [Pseudomonas sp. Irchel 3A7]|uniref:glycosyltransferase n=1 Tax=Pseudomonas sp. Irchel 3A7 TaxID=2008913 RepID=UPI00114016B4|nr:glycosyltransferase [Pseudomonas sp. Irchel 3A7]